MEQPRSTSTLCQLSHGNGVVSGDDRCVLATWFVIESGGLPLISVSGDSESGPLA